MRVIYAVTAGGTIDKAYSEQDGAVADLQSKVDPCFSRLRMSDSLVQVVSLMNKVSLEMKGSEGKLSTRL